MSTPRHNFSTQPEIPTMPPGNYDLSAAITPDDTPKDKGVPPVIEILPSSCSRSSTSSSSSHDPFTAITSDDTPKDKSVPPVTEILPSSCSRPIASSSSSHVPGPKLRKQTLDVIYELEKVRLSQMFKRCTVFSVQIDGSCDRQMLDYKFVSGRMANSDGSVTCVFVVMHSPEKNGAPGLLEAVNKALVLTGGKDTKLVGVTTDGESANTGRHGGLWRLLADQV